MPFGSGDFGGGGFQFGGGDFPDFQGGEPPIGWGGVPFGWNRYNPGTQNSPFFQPNNQMAGTQTGFDPVMGENQRQALLSLTMQRQNPGYRFPGASPFGQPQNYMYSPRNVRDPINYNNYFNNPGASNSQNRAFSIPNYDANSALLRSGYNQWAAKSLTDINPYLTDQRGLTTDLQAAARGEGPSLAQSQLKQATDRNLMQVLAARSAGGGFQNAGLANRNYLNQVGTLGQQSAIQSADLRAQEQIAARQQLQQAITSGGASTLATQGMQNQMMQYYLGQGMSLDQAQAASRQALESLLAGQYQQAQLQQNQINASNQQASDLRNQQLINAGIGAGGAVLGGFAGGLASDKRLKKKIKDGEQDMERFLNAINVHKYKYKNEKHGKGEHFSVMAQELEKTPIGRSFVYEDKEGKKVDYVRGLAVILASNAHLNKKINQLEKRS